MERQDIVSMSEREIDRYKVIQDILHHRMKQCHGAQILHLTSRQVRRLCRRVEKKGARGVVHGLRGLPSNHSLPPERIAEALALVKKHYADFGPTFANEKLAEGHQVHLSDSVLRKAMIQEGLWQPRKPKERHRAWRERRPCVGMMVQLDGSDHDWFEGRGPRCVLLIFIDDATGRILYGEFVPVEDTVNLLGAAKSYLLALGRPLVFYVDKDSIYRINRQSTVEDDLRDQQPLTQFTRAMKELDIEVVCAHSPQAKGRVERSFQTHQDRLVKELRLAGVSAVPEGNRFLREVYFPRHNARFAVPPAAPGNAHRPILPSHRLQEILSIRSPRVVAHDFTLRCQNKFFQLLKEQPYRVRPSNTVWVEKRLDNSLHLRFKDHYLNFKMIPRRPYRPFYAAREKTPQVSRRGKPSRPSRNHPWRSWSLKSHLPIWTLR